MRLPSCASNAGGRELFPYRNRLLDYVRVSELKD
jgi:hypothetical protein